MELNSTLCLRVVETFTKISNAFSPSKSEIFFNKRQILNPYFLFRPSDSLVCTGTVSGNIPNGLAASHAYTVTGIFEPRDNIPKLVKLRNPWGKSSYYGPWSKSWFMEGNMTKEWKLLDDLADGGEFYIPYDLFLKYFSTLSFCYSLGPSFTEKNAYNAWKPNKKKVQFTLYLDSDAETFIAFSQCNRRQLRDEKNSNSTLLKMKMTVFYYDHPISQEPFYKLRTRTYHDTSLRGGEYKIIGETAYIDEETQVFLRVASKSNFAII